MKKFIPIFAVILAFTACNNISEEISEESITDITEFTTTDTNIEKNVTDMDITLNLAYGSRSGKYTGTVIDNIPNGKGKFTTKNEANETWYYEGDFVDGHFSGYGKTTWISSNRIIEGKFLNDKMNGNGKLLINNIIQYDGEWKDGKFNGNGKLYSSDGSKYYQGTFSNDIIEENDLKNKCKSIGYKNLARQPEAYIMTPIKATGTVIQVVEGNDGYAEYRVAENDNYNTIYYISYTRKDEEPRILENDTINMYGLYKGLVTYESSLGGNITIPSIDVMYISINN